MERCHARRWKGVTLGGQNIVVINACVTGVECGRARVGHGNEHSKLKAKVDAQFAFFSGSTELLRQFSLVLLSRSGVFGQPSQSSNGLHEGVTGSPSAFRLLMGSRTVTAICLTSEG